MNAQPAIEKTWTPAEYLAWERLQPEKHELGDGADWAWHEAPVDVDPR